MRRLLASLSMKLPVLSDVSSVTHCQVACGATSSFCTMIGEQLVSWGKLKASGDNTMYPKVVYELAGWKIRSITAGAYTFAAAATGDTDISTITW